MHGSSQHAYTGQVSCVVLYAAPCTMGQWCDFLLRMTIIRQATAKFILVSYSYCPLHLSNNLFDLRHSVHATDAASSQSVSEGDFLLRAWPQHPPVATD